jgi:hypothetical protein
VARFDYNPLTNQLDLVDSPAGYINGVVDDPTLLPVTLGTPALDSVYLAKAGSGVWLINRKPAGLYCRVANNGDLDDWQYLGAFPEVNADGNWALYNSADPTKELKFDVSNLTTGTTRTLTVPDASGTLPLLESANTFTQNQTLDGTNNVAPNQTAASGASIMTRDLMQTRFLDWQLSSVFPVSTIPSAWAASAVGTGARGTGSNSLDIFTGTTANSSYAVANRPSGFIWYTRPGSATSTITVEWSQAIRVDFMLWVSAASTNSIFRFLIGANTAAAVADLDRRGVGIRLENLALKLHVHDGTSATTSSTLSTLSTNISYSLSIRKAAASGTVELFLNGSSVGSTTGGPSTNAGSSADGFVASILNGIDASNSRVTLQKIIFAYT